MAQIVIFGAGEIAELAHFYLTRDSTHEVVAFTVDKEYRRADSFLGLPLLDFEEAQQRFPPDSYQMFVALSYAKMNKLRAQKYFMAKQAGYQLISYVSSHCTFLSDHQVGDNCFILEDNTIQPFVKIGNNVTLWSGNHIGHESTIEDHCFVSSHVVVSGGVRIGPKCFIGVNSTIRDHVSIGERCVIGAGSLIDQDAGPEGVYTAVAAERSRVPSSRLRSI